MTQEAFTGRAAEMRKSPWLASEDLEGRGDVVVEIAGVHRHKDVEMEQGRKEPLLYSLSFKGATKSMIINGTNRRALADMFGQNVQDWKGKKIKLFVQDGIKAFGKTTKGIRIKNG